MFGPRYWLPDHTFDNPKVAAREIVVKKRNWKMSTSAPAAVAPLTWRQAFGGKLPVPPMRKESRIDAQLMVWAAAWSTRSILLTASRLRRRLLRTPRTRSSTGADTTTNRKALRPFRLGGVSASNMREPTTRPGCRIGTPSCPKTSTIAFINMRRPGLIYPGYLRGDETLVLGRMHPDFEQVRVQLPSLHLFATVRWRDGWLEQAALVLDGVHVDFFSHLAKAHLTWRCWVPRREGVKVMELRLEDPKELAEDIARHRDAPRVRGYAPMARGGL